MMKTQVGSKVIYAIVHIREKKFFIGSITHPWKVFFALGEMHTDPHVSEGGMQLRCQTVDSID